MNGFRKQKKEWVEEAPFRNSSCPYDFWIFVKFNLFQDFLCNFLAESAENFVFYPLSTGTLFS
jgi:hypothetical protein